MLRSCVHTWLQISVKFTVMQQQKADITIPCFHHGGLYAMLIFASKAFEERSQRYLQQLSQGSQSRHNYDCSRTTNSPECNSSYDASVHPQDLSTSINTSPCVMLHLSTIARIILYCVQRGLSWTHGFIDRGGWHPQTFGKQYFHMQSDSLIWGFTDDTEFMMDFEKREVCVCVCACVCMWCVHVVWVSFRQPSVTRAHTPCVAMYRHVSSQLQFRSLSHGIHVNPLLKES